jgi:succinoglycan biosynthesis transport protein ExoP
MELRRYSRALRRRLWLIVLLPIAAASVAVAVGLVTPPVYEGDAAILVRPAQPISTFDPNTNAITADQVARTYAQLMTQRLLLQNVIDDLHLNTTPAQLEQSVRVVPQANTTLLTVTVLSGDRHLAADIANKLVDDFLAQTRAIQQKQVAEYTSTSQAQVEQLKAQILREQARINVLQALGQGRSLRPDEQAELTGQQQQITSDRSQYFSIVQSVSDIEANVARATDNVIVMSPAALPGQPVSPKPALNGALALIGGLIGALALALLLDHLDQSIKTDEELIERTGLIPLTHVPLLPHTKRMSSLLTLHDNAMLAEPYKTLRTNVLYSSLDRKLSIIAVTSAIPSEGKSTVAANFAAALAAAGHRTLLMDCDFRRPAQHRLFGRVRNIGLTNLILGEASDAEAIIPVESLPDLWVTTTGPTPANPSELLSSARMRTLLERMTNTFRYLVIDTPPVNAVADPLVVASYADATIMVVEQGRASFPAVKSALRSLERVQAHVLGAVMNKVASPEDHYRYYSYSEDGGGRKKGGNGAAPAASTTLWVHDVPPPKAAR